MDAMETDELFDFLSTDESEVVELPASPAKSSVAGATMGLESIDFVVLGTPPPVAPNDKDQAKPEERARN